MLSRAGFSLVAFLLTCSSAQAWVSFTGNGTLGFYRDIDQRPHYPVYYTMGYSGQYGTRVETNASLGLSREFPDGTWRFVPALATVDVQLNSGAEWRSRARLGRQFWIEGFDVALLDGARAPFRWSATGEVAAYGGILRGLDLRDSTSAPILGVSVHEQVAQVSLHGGFSGRGDSLTQKRIQAGASRGFDEWPGQPLVAAQGEWGIEGQGLQQSAIELTVTPVENLSVSLGHSERLPNVFVRTESLSVYSYFASSAQRTEQVLLAWSRSAQSEFRIQAMGRAFAYSMGTSSARGDQEELSASFPISQGRPSFGYLSPIVGRISGYGGELWDLGLGYHRPITDSIWLRCEAAVAHLSKINSITGWAYHLKNEIQLQLSERASLALWVELERNHRFDFDSRAIASVTFFQ